ncbi:unnamed protein product, partial [Ectocarpus sp. 12 AP-2014]
VCPKEARGRLGIISEEIYFFPTHSPFLVRLCCGSFFYVESAVATRGWVSSTFQTLLMRCAASSHHVCLSVDALLQEEERVPFRIARAACCCCQRMGLIGRDDGVFSDTNNTDLPVRHSISSNWGRMDARCCVAACCVLLEVTAVGVQPTVCSSRKHLPSLHSFVRMQPWF